MTVVNVRATYVRCDFEPERVGSQWSHRYRRHTKLKVEAPADVMPKAIARNLGWLR